YSMIHVLTRAFYARGDAKTPVKIAVSMVALNLALNCTLIWTPLREAGLAWSTAICATIQAIALLMVVRRHTENILDAEVVSSWTKSLMITAVMVVIAGIVSMGLPDALTWLGSLVNLLAVVLVGGLVVCSAAGALRMPELWWVLGRRN
ncbi:MAG: polysaccharide biosynthesis C-terminal domain-containing protein, partial [Planctomycetota bacterium]|nr:polysaccharide biosynthesis C-terminal domain-containing protein [Planctomycetota bacterium]